MLLMGQVGFGFHGRCCCASNVLLIGLKSVLGKRVKWAGDCTAREKLFVELARGSLLLKKKKKKKR